MIPLSPSAFGFAVMCLVLLALLVTVVGTLLRDGDE